MQNNGLVDKRPALIAQCADATDVADAIRLTRRLGLEVAVRGGGHNVAGRATIDGGVMIGARDTKGTIRRPAPCSHQDPCRSIWNGSLRIRREGGVAGRAAQEIERQLERLVVLLVWRHIGLRARFFGALRLEVTA